MTSGRSHIETSEKGNTMNAWKLGLMAMLVSSGMWVSAASPYADVAAGDWSYEAVGKLIDSHVINGYDAAAYRRDKIATRYEMARFLANGLSKYSTATPEEKAAMDQLAEEYKNELSLLGIEKNGEGAYVAATPEAPKKEKKEKKSTVTFDGETLVEAGHVTGTEHEGSGAFGWRQRLHINARFNDHVSYHSRLQAYGQFGQSNSALKESLHFERSYAQFEKIGGIDQVQLGRMNLATGRYLALAKQGNMDGIIVRQNFGKVRAEGFAVDGDIDTELIGLNLNVAPSKAFEFNTGWFKADGSATANTETANYFDVGASVELAKGLNAVAEYTRSDAEGSPDAWAAQLSYNWVSGKRQKGLYTYEGLVDNKVPHDQGIGISYRDMEAGSIPGYGDGKTGGYGNFWSFGSVKNGQKGWMLGYQNMIFDGVRLSLQYQHLEDQQGKNSDSKYYAAFDMYFH